MLVAGKDRVFVYSLLHQAMQYRWTCALMRLWEGTPDDERCWIDSILKRAAQEELDGFWGGK